MPYTICYVSDATKGLSAKSLEEVFATTQEFNNKTGISGILFYRDEMFFQILEGPEEELKYLFERIKRDNRHKNIFTILEKQVEDRIFEGYKSGFSIIKSFKDLMGLKKYLEIPPSSGKYSKTISGILQPFIM